MNHVITTDEDKQSKLTEADNYSRDILERVTANIQSVSLRDLEKSLDANIIANDIAIEEVTALIEQVILLETEIAKVDRPRPTRSRILLYLISNLEDFKVRRLTVEQRSLLLKLGGQEARAWETPLNKTKFIQILEWNLDLRQGLYSLNATAKDAMCLFTDPTIGSNFTPDEAEKRTAIGKFNKVQRSNKAVIELLMNEQDSLSRKELEDAVDDNWCMHLNLKEFLEGEDLLKEIDDILSTGLKLKFSLQQAYATNSFVPFGELLIYLQACEKHLSKTKKFMDKNELWPEEFRTFDEEMQPRTKRQNSSMSEVSLSVYPSNPRFLSYNIFLRPPAPPNTNDDYKQERLYRFAQEALGRFDVVCLQEMFGSFSSRRRELVEKAKSLGFLSIGKSPTNVLRSGFLVDGGLLVLSRLPFMREAIYHTFKCSGKYSDKVAAKGIMYMKVQINTNSFMHLAVTHLQSCYSLDDGTKPIRDKQIAEIVEFLKEQCRDDPREREPECPPHLAAAPAPSGSDGERVWPLLLCGDLNINGRKSPIDGSHSEDYLIMQQQLSELGEFHDLVFNSYGEHQVTYADTTDRTLGFLPKEKVLTCPTDYDCDSLRRQSLDYAFYYPAPDSKINPEIPKIPDPLVPTTCKIERFEIDRTKDIGAPISQLSDHYGIDLTFSLLDRRKSNK